MAYFFCILTGLYMKNFIPQFIAEEHKAGRIAGSFKGSVMSLDLKGFTKMTGELMKNGKFGAEILSDIINKVFEPVIVSIYGHGGYITAFVGDAITAVFPEKYAAMAEFAALEITDYFKKNRSATAEKKKFQIEVRIGLSFGDVEWNIVSTPERSVYFFKGGTIYKAAEAQQKAEPGTCLKDNSYEFFPPAQKISVASHVKIPGKVLERFVPDRVLEMKTAGEFREIVSVYISFDEKETDIIELSKTLCTESVRYKGYLNKIDFGDKGGIALVFFGAPFKEEKYPEYAVSFATEMVKKFPGTKIGMAKGTAFCGFVGSTLRSEYTALGEVVNLSARLLSVTPEGEIRTDEWTTEYRYKNFSFKETGVHLFKGFSSELKVYSPYAAKEPKNKSHTDKTAFIGRESEKDLITDFIKTAFKTKVSGYIQINGDPGIGKSRLISAVSNDFEKEQIKWLYLQCDEIIKSSLNPFSYFFKNRFGIHDEQTAEENRKLLQRELSEYKDIDDYERILYYIGRIVGVKIENADFESLESRESYENLIFSIRDFFLLQSEDRPFVVEIDDIHNIDPDSKEALQALLRKSGPFAPVIVSSARFDPDGSIFKSGIVCSQTQNVSLTSLDRDSVRSLAEHILNTKISPELLELLQDKCSGNPFYTEQMTLYLKESGLIIKRNNVTEIVPGEIDVPDRISSVIISRIDKLSSELKRLIRTASVLGKEFSVKLLAEVLKKKNISSQVDKAEDEAIWSKTTEIFYIFKHALLRDTVYEMQLKKTLKELHLTTAKTIESLYYDEPEKHYSELAYHFEKAGENGKTKKYLNLAGKSSFDNYRNNEGINYFSKLYGYCGTEEERAEALRVIGEFYIRLGDWKNTESFFRKSYRKALRSASPLQIVKSGISLSEYYGETGDLNKNIRLIKKMQVKAEKHKFQDELNMIYLNLGIIYRLKSEKHKAEDYYFKSLKYYRQKKDQPMIRTIYDNLGVLYMSAGDFDKAKYYYKLAEKRSLKYNDKFGLMNIYNNVGMIYYHQGNLKKALEVYNISLELAEELGILRHKGIVYGQFAGIYFYMADYKKALDYSLKGFEISEEMGDSFSQCYLLSSIGVLYRKLGQPDKAMECFEKQSVISHSLGLKELISLSLDNIAFMHSLMGRFTESTEMYQKAKELNIETENKISLAVSYANMGENFKHLKDYKRSLELYHEAIGINENLSLKFQLVSTYYYISEVYAESNDTKNALKYIGKCKELAKELERNDYYFKSEVLANTIDISIPAAVRADKLIKMDSKELSDEDRASLYKAVFAVSGKNIYRKKALEIYKGLYEKLKYYEYKKALEELS